MTDGRMSISELADRSGLTIPTIKFYIRQGLLAPGTKMNRTRSWYGLDHRVRPRPHAGRTPFDGTEVIDIDWCWGCASASTCSTSGGSSPRARRSRSGQIRPRRGVSREPAGGPPTAPAIELVGLAAGYAGTAVVRDLDVRVGRREVIALLGQNGAGKTTTLRAIAGLLAPIGGRPGSAWWRCFRRWSPCCSAGPGRCREGSSRCLPSPGHWRPGRGACWWTR